MKKDYSDKHTFVICAYKESAFLEECIESLEEQTVTSTIIMVTSTPCDYISNMAQKHGIELYVNDGETGISGNLRCLHPSWKLLRCGALLLPSGESVVGTSVILSL